MDHVRVSKPKRSNQPTVRGVVDISGMEAESVEDFICDADDIVGNIRIQRRGSKTLLLTE